MKIQAALKESNIFLMKNNIRNSQLDSEILMSKVIGKDRKYIILNLNKTLKKKEILKFKSLIEQRSKGKPIAYLTNKKFFWKYEFFVNDQILIPRPDTELIVDQVLKMTKNKFKLKFLDIGIGSGCILLSILKEKPLFHGVGIDISKKCINISKKNAQKLKVENRVKFFKTDVDNFVEGKYDLIISNPPYIKKFDVKYLERDVANFEPKQALDGGIDGVSEIRKVIKKSSEMIKINGKLILEIAFDQREKVKNILKQNGFYINETLKDLANNDRCIISTKI